MGRCGYVIFIPTLGYLRYKMLELATGYFWMVEVKNRSEGREAILVVGDVDSVVSLRFLQNRGFALHRVADLSTALNQHELTVYRIALVNLSAARRCNLSDLSQLKSVYRAAKLIVIDGEGSIDAAVAAIKAGAWDYLHRPIPSDELGEKIAQAQMTTEEWVQRNADPVVVYIGRHATAISCRAEVANRFGLSLDTVSSRVRAVTGKTFVGYLHRCRVDQAKNLLESTELNVAQVAARVGFTTPQHFSRVFRRHMDLSPARYRLQERVDKEPRKKQ